MEESEQWSWTYQDKKPQKKGKQRGKDRSESVRRYAKGEGKGHKGKNKGRGGAEQQAHQQHPTIPPWPSQETSTTATQAPIPPAQSAASVSNAEWLAVVRKSYPDLSQAPEDIQKAVEKAEKASSKALSKDLNKASNQVGKAARQLTNIKEARDSHRQNWLKHLKDSVASWQKQLQVFKDQQQEYGEQMLKAQQELTSSRSHLQNLNKQAAATGPPVSTVSGDSQPEPTDLENSAAFEMEAQALVQQVQESLQQSIAAAATPNETMEIQSDEDGDRRSKRPRSMEPFGGPEAGHGGGAHSSSPRS
jgi:hypothetical protein